MYRDQSGKILCGNWIEASISEIETLFVRWTWLSVGIDEIPFLKVDSNCFPVSVTLRTLHSIQDVFHVTSTIQNLKHWSVRVKFLVHLKDADQ